MSNSELILDATKLQYHMDRVYAWERGERIAPITIDMALTRKCDAACGFCYAMLQSNAELDITEPIMADFLEDSARMGVRGISLVSDGESLLSPVYEFSIVRGHSLGIDMASGTNGHRFTPEILESVLPALTYLRYNVSAGTRDRYSDIMGVKPAFYDRVMRNIKTSVEIKKRLNLKVTIGIQMVLMPQDSDQVIPFAELGLSLGVDYAVIKHCSDDEFGSLGIDYAKYKDLYDVLHEAEALSTKTYKCIVKWNKIEDGHTYPNGRAYQRCYGPPFILQMSGSGLIAPCGMMFNDRYAKFHIGNICEDRWWDIWQSDRYWDVVTYLASDEFDAQKSCGTLCLQHQVNSALDSHRKGEVELQVSAGVVPHINFV